MLSPSFVFSYTWRAWLTFGLLCNRVNICAQGRLLIQAIRSRYRKRRAVPLVFADEAAARDVELRPRIVSINPTPTNLAANEVGFMGRLEVRGFAHGVTTRNFWSG